MSNPLERSILSAVRANARIGEAFGRLGTQDHPRGFVISAYRSALKDIGRAVGERYPAEAVREVMAGLRASVRDGLRAELARSWAFGTEEARRQLGFYGVEAPWEAYDFTGKAESALDACLAKIDAQAAVANALLMTGASSQVTGDAERAGVVRYSDVVAAAAYWVAALAWAGFSAQVIATPGGERFKKQAVAALDNRTTDCCLRVHGQVQPFDKPFTLTGTPRYADRMDWPAFHAYCRTSGVLYLDGFDDGLTDRMRAGARAILDERAAGKFIDRHPADAFG